MTPKRAEATCLIRASRRSPSGPGAYHAGSSPPSPVFAAPPARWIPIVSAWWASGDSAPTLIAETTNRRAIERASSTSSSGDRRATPADAEPVAGDARRGAAGASVVAVRGEGGVDAAAGSSAARQRSVIAVAFAGAYRWSSPSPRKRAKPGIGQPARGPRRPGDGPRPPRAPELDASPRSASLERPGHAAAAGKQRATTAASSSSVSNSSPPMYEATALMPIRARILRSPASSAATRFADGVGRRSSVLGAARARLLARQLDREPRMDRPGAGGEDHRQRRARRARPPRRPRGRSGHAARPR